MNIILTHEQADFDALASLLGAHLVDETSLPVLPRRMNRNVRAFITLYGVELPFVDPRDLPNQPVERVTLVDTQSMISVKGMGPETKVQVIDHHPGREGLPPNWEITTADTGATATLFVEVLRERDNLLSAIAATLLLLGIYEDTGSLTYTRTSPRDLSAAAFLLERGASLEIATDFLNHPLSPGQQALYDHMRANAKSHNVHGHTVILACGDAQEVDEELSTVAHKMRDLLDPNALFLLANTRGGVQLIARSTSDHIDVAQIAEYFGGGGHERAAASLIKDGQLEGVCQELLAILPRYIHPAVTVAQIMSGSPQLLTPDTPVEEAAQRMLRYGYEGYPVVQAGKVVGLLNRRSVDRALSHKLYKKTAANLMDAGEVSVHPEDSLEHLQRVMTETGWGQVPVVHTETGQIIGIVTRTDLLKTLSGAQRIPSRQNLADRLENALPPARLSLLKTIARVAHEQHAALFIVGGFVRDLLLDRPGQDFDLVVEGDAIELARNLARAYGGRVTSHSRFGTAKWHIGGIRPDLADVLKKAIETHFTEGKPQHATRNFNITDLPEFVDLITARSEFYTHPTALPTVERGSIKLDLHRRDFTINTLALRLDGYHYGELHDYWGGLNDLRSGLVRALHSLSFIDDPTRMLRAVRFEQRFAFQIEGRTLELIQEARDLLGRVSGDRIRHELDHILQEDRVSPMLARLHELDLLTAIHSDLAWDEWLADHIQLLKQAKPEPEWRLGENTTGLTPSLIYILWLIRLPSTRAHSLISRLKLSHSLSEAGLAARRLWRDLPSFKYAAPSQVVSGLEKIPILAVYANYLVCADANLQQVILNYVTRWRNVSPTIDGHALRARGLPPGPRYRQILATLRDAWLDGKIESREQEAALLEEIINIQTGVKD